MRKTCTKCNKDSDYWSPTRNCQLCLFCKAFISDEKVERKESKNICQNCGSHDGIYCECGGNSRSGSGDISESEEMMAKWGY